MLDQSSQVGMREILGGSDLGLGANAVSAIEVQLQRDNFIRGSAVRQGKFWSP